MPGLHMVLLSLEADHKVTGREHTWTLGRLWYRQAICNGSVVPEDSSSSLMVGGRGVSSSPSAAAAGRSSSVCVHECVCA